MDDTVHAARLLVDDVDQPGICFRQAFSLCQQLRCVADSGQRVAYLVCNTA